MATSPVTRTRTAPHAPGIVALVLNVPASAKATATRIPTARALETVKTSLADLQAPLRLAKVPSSALARVVTAAEMTIAVAAVIARATVVARSNSETCTDFLPHEVHKYRN